MPALGGFNPRSPFGQLQGQKPQVPQLFFTLTEEEIVTLLVSQGFSPKTAAQEAAKFMRYKENIVGPRQEWSEGHCSEHVSFLPTCEKCQAASAKENEKPQAPTEAPTRRFADEVAERKGE